MKKLLKLVIVTVILGALARKLIDGPPHDEDAAELWLTTHNYKPSRFSVAWRLLDRAMWAAVHERDPSSIFRQATETLIFGSEWADKRAEHRVFRRNTT